MTRRLLVLCFTWIFLVTGVAPGSAWADAPAGSSKPRYADVAVETQSLGSAGPVVRRRVRERADVVLRRGGVLPPRDADDPVISVTVDELTGDEPGYVFRVEILVNGVAAQKATPVECRLCTEGELVDAVEGRLEHAVADLPTAGGAEVPPPRVDPTPPIGPKLDPEVDKPPGKGMKIAGATMLGVGGAGLIAGAVMAALEPKPKSGDPTNETSTKKPGYALLGVGAGLVITGAVLLIVDATRRKKHKRSTTARAR